MEAQTIANAAPNSLPIPESLSRKLVTEDSRAEVTGSHYRCINNDCVLELQSHPENSVDMFLTSIPFGNQYEYSPTFNDFGHCPSDTEFFAQMDFLCPEMHRTLKPGRIAAIHVKDRIMFGNVTGFASPTVNPFSDKTTVSFLKAGFVLMARITIDTDVVRENNQTYRLGWSENAKDGTKMGAGMPEYVLVFRKLPTDLSNAYADVPVTKSKAEYTRADWQLDAAGLWRSNGNRLPDPAILQHLSLDEIKALWIRYSLQKPGSAAVPSGSVSDQPSSSTANDGNPSQTNAMGVPFLYSHENHVALAKSLEATGKLPASFMLFPAVSRHADIWTDISRMRTLNSEQSRRNQELHVCPLQLDIIKRLITRYSNPDDIVADPFGGIGSVAYQALQMGRQALTIELNTDYFKNALAYCQIAEAEASAPTLFDITTLMA